VYWVVGIESAVGAGGLICAWFGYLGAIPFFEKPVKFGDLAVAVGTAIVYPLSSFYTSFFFSSPRSFSLPSTSAWFLLRVFDSAQICYHPNLLAGHQHNRHVALQPLRVRNRRPNVNPKTQNFPQNFQALGKPHISRSYWSLAAKW
jgi:hypothetical protein